MLGHKATGKSAAFRFGELDSHAELHGIAENDGETNPPDIGMAIAAALGAGLPNQVSRRALQVD